MKSSCIDTCQSIKAQVKIIQSGRLIQICDCDPFNLEQRKKRNLSNANKKQPRHWSLRHNQSLHGALFLLLVVFVLTLKLSKVKNVTLLLDNRVFLNGLSDNNSRATRQLGTLKDEIFIYGWKTCTTKTRRYLDSCSS